MRSVRVKFKKFGSAKFISHLDLNRFMIKAIRRSKIPVWYSEGFNPHPYITFALPLSLGFDSDCEYMDIRLDDDNFSNQEVYDALRDLMPSGLLMESCDNPIMKAGEIGYCDYKIIFETGDTSVVDDIVSFLALDAIITQKKTKKGSYKDINLKEYVKDYRVDNESVTLTLAAGGSNNLNPKLILEAFEKRSNSALPYYNICRTMIYNDKMEEYK